MRQFKIKVMLFKKVNQDGDTQWVGKPPGAKSAANKMTHDALLREAPAVIKGEAIVKFRILQDDGLKHLANAKQLKPRQERLVEEGELREMLPRQQWQRAYKPSMLG